MQSPDELLFRRILIATDGSALSEKAIRLGTKLARRMDADIVGFTAVSDFRVLSLQPGLSTLALPRHERNPQDVAKDALVAVERMAQAEGVRFSTDYAVSDKPGETIVEAARRHGCDLIVMAGHGHGAVAGMVLGSETSKVLSRTDIPVLVCR